MRRRFGRRRSFKRQTSWIAGISGFDYGTPAASRSVTFSAITGVDANYRLATASITSDTDLQYHGGEGMVVNRIVVDYIFYSMRIATDTAATIPCLFLVYQAESELGDPTSFFGQDLISSAGLGSEDVLYTQLVIPSAGTSFTRGSAGDLGTTEAYVDARVRANIKARRRIMRDRHLYWSLATVDDGANVPQDCRFTGFLKTLVTRGRR